MQRITHNVTIGQTAETKRYQENAGNSKSPTVTNLTVTSLEFSNICYVNKNWFGLSFKSKLKFTEPVFFYDWKMV